MSRKKKGITKTNIEAATIAPAAMPKRYSLNLKLLYLLIFVFASGLYFNTINNEYTLDDSIVITDNEYTKAGFSGIKDIFSHDSFSGVPDMGNQLSGGRYRPLSIATFAIEYGIFGASPSISHLVNALLYGVLCLLLFYFLKQYIFRNNLAAALLAALIFAVHPLHADVVANIKGRDEILSLLLLIACLIFYLEYSLRKKLVLLVASLGAFFLSLLAKENGITFLAIIPMTLYFFMNKKLKDSLLAVWPFVLIFSVYLLIRVGITGFATSDTSEVMNAPFALAQGDQEFATKIMILGKDLLMLIFPHPLSYDYSYNQIPYVHFSDWKCLLSLLVNGLLVFFAVKLFKKRHILSFSILFYYITLSIVTNFVFEVGSPFNERFLFQPSVGFAIALAYLLTSYGGANVSIVYKALALFISVSLVIGGAVKTILRNTDWENNDTLFIADAQHAPNSARTTCFAGIAFLYRAEKEKDSLQKNKLIDTSITYLRRALVIHPNYVDAYIDLGIVYIMRRNLDSSKANFMKAKAIYPDNSKVVSNLKYLAEQFNAEAVRQFGNKNTAAAIKASYEALECMPENITALYNLGGYYLTIQNVEMAREAWSKAHALDPGNATIKLWLDKIALPPPKN